MGLCFNGVLLAVPAGVETWNWTTVAQPWRLINLPFRRGFQILTTEYYYYYRIQIAVIKLVRQTKHCPARRLDVSMEFPGKHHDMLLNDLDDRKITARKKEVQK
ncbi:uncharacterized protein ASPGLDRAFT_1452710 [Aspergillus glaucus CBS 516.65]|uniref:Uncharacterized protein n=1 Tax=Aspergillus glaucus CBS 516.65 TaxID=1160497 RepID=A0A1L9VKU4_ASPGL|nr:hypothetical protein ASPGLDRAFT_1452710 [Aspergillus glaucus CBS 516.65]OJJ84533.1 hypothetical protein ASPGLDRAFT_1452710 [Aspergillus glaucus CBS 516.65]